MSGRTLQARTKFCALQAQAIAGSQAVGRQPAIPRSLEYRTILYKTTFVLDKFRRHVSDKLRTVVQCKAPCSFRRVKYIFYGETGPRVGFANISYT